MLKLTALILAGGKGTRLAGSYPDLPKALVSVGGEPFLHWLILWLKREGIADLVFSLGYRGEQIEDWLKAAPATLDIKWRSFREPKPLGTGGGARACLHLCGDNLLVTNGDSLLLTPLAPAMNRLADSACDGVIMGLPVADARRYGSLVTDVGDRLVGFHEKQPGAGPINGGVYLLRKQILENFPAAKNLSMEYDVVPQLIAAGRRIFVQRAEAGAPFIDIGTPESAAEAGDLIERYFC